LFSEGPLENVDELASIALREAPPAHEESSTSHRVDQ
jgi:hypothetical protein